nr:hypothetical protein [Tanacetum cinerariifolium]
ELADSLSEALIIDRLGDVDVAAEVVAALDLHLVVGGGQHHHRGPLQRAALGLDPGEDVGAAHVGQVEIEQHQRRAVLGGTIGRIEQEFERL